MRDRLHVGVGTVGGCKTSGNHALSISREGHGMKSLGAIHALILIARELNSPTRIMEVRLQAG